MTKNELIRFISKRNGELSIKDSSEMVEKVLDGIVSALEEGHDVKLLGFGNFEIVDRKPHKGRNPRTGKEVIVPARRSVRFKTGKVIKEALGVPEE